jgi:hypothetical protein
MTWKAIHVAQPVARDYAVVAAFAGDPRNLPRWAKGLSSGIRLDGDRWLTDSPLGTVEVIFVGHIDLGVLDHDVIFPDGTTVHNPMRVLRNDDGSEVVFTVYQRDGVTDEEFASDAVAVRADLARLRDLMEEGTN